ncbi:MAG: aspartyl protease family protein [Cyanobacteria bacterium J06560_6]
MLTAPERNDNRACELDAFLDTGADVTLIPLEAVSVLRLPLMDERVSVVGVGGALTIGFPCRIDLQLGDVELRSIRVVSCTAFSISSKPGQMIVGRDVLNQFCVRFDGKQGRFLFEED